MLYVFKHTNENYVIFMANYQLINTCNGMSGGDSNLLTSTQICGHGAKLFKNTTNKTLFHFNVSSMVHFQRVSTPTCNCILEVVNVRLGLEGYNKVITCSFDKKCFCLQIIW